MALFFSPNLVDVPFLADELSVVNIRFFLILGLLAFVLAAGWHREVLTDSSPPLGRGARRWVIAVGAVLAVYAVLSVTANLGVGAALLSAAIATTAITALYEELLFRGIAVGGLRGSRWSELSVWLVSTVAFAVLHLTNAVTEGVLKAVVQVLFAVGAGSTLYLARRLGRGIWLAVLLHFLNNLGALVVTGIDGIPPNPVVGSIGGVVYLVVVVVLLASFVVTLLTVRREARRPQPVAA